MYKLQTKNFSTIGAIVSPLLGVLIAFGFFTENAHAGCQDVCLLTSGGSLVDCLDDSDCTGGGSDYCVSSGCCDQAEEDGADDSPPTGACACGDELDGNVKLRHDIVCTEGDGLFVDDSGETLNMNGFKISCDASTDDCGTGVTLTDNGKVKGSSGGALTGGRIEGFWTGVHSTDGEGEASHLTITDGGLSMNRGTFGVEIVKRNVISGAAAGIFGGNGIDIGDATNCRIEDNLITDSTRAIAIGPTQGTDCRVTHNRAIGNDVGFSVAGTFDAANSSNNIFLNNSTNDYVDTTTTDRLSTDDNLCSLSGAGNACTLEGMNFTP